MNYRYHVSLVILAVYILAHLSACQSSTGQQANEETELSKDSLKYFASLLTDDLLSREEFMIYETPGVYSVHYAEICAAYGALKVAGLNNDRQTIENIISRYQRVKDENIPNTANHVDANLYGILPLQIYLLTQDSSYLMEGLELADGQWEQTTADGLSYQTRYWIDDVYMIAALQCQAYRATGQSVYIDRAAKEVHAYIDSLQESNGLYHHGPEAPFFWGRGNGWVASGIAELLSDLPESHPHYPSIVQAYQTMMATLLDYQGENGMWHQLIDDPSSFEESSSTAMFANAMATGVRKGLLPIDPYKESYRRAWKALQKKISAEGKITDICVGTGQSLDKSYYLNRPRITGDFHGQAPALWLIHELMEE